MPILLNVKKCGKFKIMLVTLSCYKIYINVDYKQDGTTIYIKLFYSVLEWINNTYIFMHCHTSLLHFIKYFGTNSKYYFIITFNVLQLQFTCKE
jgi:hypothetical protein